MSSNESDVQERKLLSWSKAEKLSKGNALFRDNLFQRCYMAALDSACQKMRFGCVVTHNGKVVGEGCNATIGPMKSLCEPVCIRFDIPSRTESMVGACAHAEESALWQAIHAGAPINECELFIAGVHNTDVPWIKTEAMHSCLRCAVQMHHAKLRSIWVPVVDHWEQLSTGDAIRTATDYATKVKSV